MNILGISAYYHDSAAALLRDGKIVTNNDYWNYPKSAQPSS